MWQVFIKFSVRFSSWGRVDGLKTTRLVVFYVIYERKSGRAAGIKITEAEWVIGDVQYEAKETFDLSHKNRTRLSVDPFLVTEKMYLGTQRSRRSSALCTHFLTCLDTWVAAYVDISNTAKSYPSSVISKIFMPSAHIRFLVRVIHCSKMGLGEVWFLLGYIA